MNGATPDPRPDPSRATALCAAQADAGPAAGQICDRVGTRLAASGAAAHRHRTVPGGVLGRPLAGAAVARRARSGSSCSCCWRLPLPCRWSAFPLAEPRAGPEPARPRLRHRAIARRPTLTDTLSTQDPVALALWQAQRERTLASLKRIRAGLPSPRLRLYDPWALRGAGRRDAGRGLLRRRRRARLCGSARRSTGTACWRRPISASMPGSIRRSIPASRRSSCRPPTRRPPRCRCPARSPVPAGSTLIVRSSRRHARRGRRRRRQRRPRRPSRRPRAPTRSISPSRATAPCMCARPPASRNGSSPRSRIVRRRSRSPRIRSGRPAARCRWPTRSRTITASPKRQRAVRRPRRGRRRARRGAAAVHGRRNFRWCCRMRAPATASARR